MKKFYEEFFYVSKHGKVQEKTLYTHTAVTVVLILICMGLMSLAGYAYFSSNISSVGNVLQAASFEATISIVDKNGVPVPLTSNGDNVYQVVLKGPVVSQSEVQTLSVEENGTSNNESGTSSETNIIDSDSYETYIVTLSYGNSTAQTGFCKVLLNGQLYNTQQIGTDVNAENGFRESVTFEVEVAEDITIAIFSHWGTSSNYAMQTFSLRPVLTETDDFYIVDGEIIKVEKTELPIDDDNSEVLEDPDAYTKDTYVVSEGETLAFIAELFNIDVQRLMAYNQLESEDVEIGQVIKVPFSDWIMPEIVEDEPVIRESEIIHTVLADETLESIAATYETTVDLLLAYNEVDSLELSVGQELKIHPTGWTVPVNEIENVEEPPQEEVDPTVVHTVQIGDTWEGISSKYGISAEKIIAYNNVEDSVLIEGAVLVIPPIDWEMPIETPVNTESSGNEEANTEDIHTVGVGETLESIAADYSTSVDLILAYNKIDNIEVIEGQQLKIPPKDFVLSENEVSENGENSDSELEGTEESEDPYVGRQYFVKNGDTLEFIANLYDSTVELIAAYNNLENQELYEGQELLIPPSDWSIPAGDPEIDESEETSKHRAVYEIKTEDETLEFIAKLYDTTVEILVAYNELENDAVVIGQMINIPPLDWVIQKENPDDSSDTNYGDNSDEKSDSVDNSEENSPQDSEGNTENPEDADSTKSPDLSEGNDSTENNEKSEISEETNNSDLSSEADTENSETSLNEPKTPEEPDAGEGTNEQEISKDIESVGSPSIENNSDSEDNSVDSESEVQSDIESIDESSENQELANSNSEEGQPSVEDEIIVNETEESNEVKEILSNEENFDSEILEKYNSLSE